MKNLDSVADPLTASNTYREILPNYNLNNHLLLRDGFKQLKIGMGFTQIRFYCLKKERGRVIHIMTSNNSMGTDVVNFFTVSNTLPRACGSFTRLPNDNSSLAQNCDKWGYPTKDRWGHALQLGDDHLFKRPFLWEGTRFYKIIPGNSKNLQCDDINDSLSLGDRWEVFVR